MSEKYEKCEISSSSMEDSATSEFPPILISTMMNKRRIFKNFFILAFAHFLVFTAFDTLGNLQSTMNIDQGMGTASQAVIYACLSLASLFLPTVLIKKMGCKSTLVLSIIFICPYILANLFPRWEFLLPAGALSGLALGPLWAARSTYVNQLAFEYCNHMRGSFDAINAWFFGMYSFFHENAEIWGNLMSYVILKSNQSHIPLLNGTITCGAEFCDFRSYNSNPNLIPPTEEKRYALNLTFLGLLMLALPIIQLWLDPLNNTTKSEEATTKGLSIFQMLTATLRHLKKTEQLLLLPLSFYVGLADGFYNADFTKSFITCEWGISQVGLVTIAYGVVCAIMDCFYGPLVKIFSRGLVFTLGCLAHIGFFCGCLLWIPSNMSPTLPFVFSGIYALGASVWWSQIAALYGDIFQGNEEAAFSNFYFWSSLGYVVAYSYSDYICTFVKIYILVILLLVGICGYYTVEIRSNKVRTKIPHSS